MFWLFLVLAGSLSAQISFLPGSHHLRGTVGSERVTMDIVDGEAYYSYDRIGRPIRLAGSETHFSGRQTADGVFRGVSKDAESGQTLPVILRPSPTDSPLRLTRSLFKESRTFRNGKVGWVNFARLRLLAAQRPALAKALDRTYANLLQVPSPVKYQPGITERQARDEFWSEDFTASEFLLSPRIVWNAKGLLSISTWFEMYSDGVRGFDGFAYASYDVERGTMLVLDDLFKPDSREELNKIFQLAVRELETEPNSFAVTENFLVTPQGLLFRCGDEQYNGRHQLDVFLPFTDLEPLLKPEIQRFRN